MLPTIKHGDLVLIDRSQTEIRSDGLYVFSKEGDLYLKRLQKIGDGLRVLSDNNALYPPFELKQDALEGVKVIGRVVSVGKFDNL